MELKICIFLIFVSLTVVNGTKPSCKNWEGRDVDWFIAYKLPIQAIAVARHDNQINQGKTVFYADADNQEMKLLEGTDNMVDGHTNAIAYTTQRALNAKHSMSSEMYAFYNDHHPDDTRAHPDFAHAKGFLVFNENQGFWMLHTVPRFPQVDEATYKFATNGFTYGQIFFCATYNSDQLGEIAAQLYTSRMSFYDKFLPPAMRSKWPTLHKVFHGSTTSDIMENAPFWRYTRLETLEGLWLDNFQKYKYSQSDLYANIVSESLKMDFYVQSYPDAASVMFQSACDNRRFKTKNVRSVARNHPILGGGHLPMGWENTKDHSKWAVSVFPDEHHKHILPTFCFGDINRQPSQKARGGGAMCFVNTSIWEFFNTIIHDRECCDGDEPENCVDSTDNSVITPNLPINYQGA